MGTQPQGAVGPLGRLLRGVAAEAGEAVNTTLRNAWRRYAGHLSGYDVLGIGRTTGLRYGGWRENEKIPVKAAEAAVVKRRADQIGIGAVGLTYLVAGGRYKGKFEQSTKVEVYIEVTAPQGVRTERATLAAAPAAGKTRVEGAKSQECCREQVSPGRGPALSVKRVTCRPAPWGINRERCGPFATLVEVTRETLFRVWKCRL